MKFEALRRSLVRYFGRPATRGRGEIARTAPTVAFPDIWTKVSYGPVRTEPPAETTRVLDPPIDWAKWAGYADEHSRPGWCFCRFALKGPAPENRINFHYGIVRGPFGVHAETMLLGQPIGREQVVWGITHLRGGFGCGLFLSLEAACSAAEIAMRLSSVDWENIEVDSADRLALTADLGRMHTAWVCANLAPAPFLAISSNPKVPPMNVWYREFTPESRPTKEQMS